MATLYKFFDYFWTAFHLDELTLTLEARQQAVVKEPICRPLR